jgi:hypothetical protein
MDGCVIARSYNVPVIEMTVNLPAPKVFQINQWKATELSCGLEEGVEM